MRRAALLAALLAAPCASADPVVIHHARPEFSLTVPDRFQRVSPESPRPDLIGVFRRAGDLPDEPPMVLQLLDLDASLPQRALLPGERDALRRTDAFRFVDRVEHDRALGFSVETLAGTAPLLDGANVVRFAAALPLDGDAVLVVLLAPSHRARDARALFRATLASARGPTTWETPTRRAVNRAMRIATLGALLLSLAYAVVALVTSRRRPLAPRTRRLAKAALAGLWWAVALWLCVPWRDEEWLFAANAVGLALTFSALAYRQVART